jgi:hypothetical protein
LIGVEDLKANLIEVTVQITGGEREKVGKEKAIKGSCLQRRVGPGLGDILTWGNSKVIVSLTEREKKDGELKMLMEIEIERGRREVKKA